MYETESCDELSELSERCMGSPCWNDGVIVSPRLISVQIVITHIFCALDISQMCWFNKEFNDKQEAQRPAESAAMHIQCTVVSMINLRIKRPRNTEDQPVICKSLALCEFAVEYWSPIANMVCGY